MIAEHCHGGDVFVRLSFEVHLHDIEYISAQRT